VKPLLHPSVDDITVEGIMYALGDPVRAHIFAEIIKAERPQLCSAFLDVDDKAVPKSTLSNHFSVLREAGLIRSERKGVEVHNTPRDPDLQDRFGPLIAAIMEAHAAQAVRRRKSNRP
jgi:DNA-binding transcriptional ArsR family regulator